MDNVIPPSAPRPRGGRCDREGTTRGLCSPSHGATARYHTPGFRGHWARLRDRRVHRVPTVTPPLTYPVRSRRRANPVRFSVARELGRDIDGAWWPRADRITNELPNLVAVLTPLLGDISSINVNWPPLQRPPEFNWPGWEHKRQHVMSIIGKDACVNLLIVPYATYSGLALMVLRCAANLPIEAADRRKPAFLTAGAIVRAAQQQRASDGH
jgi:hypothetical protein